MTQGAVHVQYSHPARLSRGFAPGAVTRIVILACDVFH